MEECWTHRKVSLFWKLKCRFVLHSIVVIIIRSGALGLNCTVAHGRQNKFKFSTKYKAVFAIVMLVRQHYNMGIQITIRLRVVLVEGSTPSFGNWWAKVVFIFV